MTTAAYLWPVTGRARLTYNLPEVFANRWWDNQSFCLSSARKLLVSGSSGPAVWKND
ncbi:MAG: hypothetical protein ACLR23_24850 [Clostridia bacterium]